MATENDWKPKQSSVSDAGETLQHMPLRNWKIRKTMQSFWLEVNNNLVKKQLINHI